MSAEQTELAAALLALGRAVRRQVEHSRTLAEPLSEAIAEVGGDQQFWIDRRVEPSITRLIENWPARLRPVLLYCEGFPQAPWRVGGPGPAKYHVMIDPIDGTRGLMHDKRSAWFLSVAAPGSIPSPRLNDALVSVAVELPTSKQGLYDEFVWRRADGVTATRGRSRGARQPLSPRPSSARSLEHGFGTVVTYFPRNILPAARLAESIRSAARADFFEDQYISSGGQMIELAMGRDRFVCDLRAEWPDELGLGRKAARPYDLAAAPIAKALGVVLRDPWGEELDAPFSLDLELSWCGYANHEIRRLVEPHVASATSWSAHQSARTPAE